MKKLFFMVAFILTLLVISTSRVKGEVYLYEEISLAVPGTVYTGTTTLTTDGTFGAYRYFEAFYYWKGTGTVLFLFDSPAYSIGTPTINSHEIINPLILDTLKDAQRIKFRTLDGGVGTISASYSIFNMRR